jgi:hypothetical protein
MARTTPRPPPTEQRMLTPLRHDCPVCGGRMWFAYENRRVVSTLEAVVELRLPIRRCVSVDCERFHRPYRPEEEGRWALPHHEFGLDVVAWIGAQRYREQRSVAEIHQALVARGVAIAPRTVEYLLGRYDELLSLSLQDRTVLRTRLSEPGRLILALDGLQPDVGHEVLWVVREVLSGEVLVARSMLSSTQAELEALLDEALAGLDGVPVVGVISDGQHSIRKAVAARLPGVAHQLCQFHYLREASRPIWEADRHAKKALKKRLRDIRPIERAVEGRTDEEAQVVQGYCAAIRSALTDDGHPPLNFSGLHLHERVEALEASLTRLGEKGGRCRSH